MHRQDDHDSDCGGSDDEDDDDEDELDEDDEEDEVVSQSDHRWAAELGDGDEDVAEGHSNY